MNAPVHLESARGARTPDTDAESGETAADATVLTPGAATHEVA